MAGLGVIRPSGRGSVPRSRNYKGARLELRDNNGLIERLWGKSGKHGPNPKRDPIAQGHSALVSGRVEVKLRKSTKSLRTVSICRLYC
jgi:hypothetical protein